MILVSKKKINKCNWIYIEKDIERKDPNVSLNEMYPEDARKFKLNKTPTLIRNDETLNCCQENEGTGYSIALYEAVCGH